MQELNLDVAGEFMVMAATLIHIKSKMLVPVDPTEAQGDEEQEDPREALVQRLLEFQRYKEAAGILHQKAQIRAATWTRPDTVLPAFDDAGEEMLEAGLFDLISAFKELLERRKTLLAHEVASRGQEHRAAHRGAPRPPARGRVAGLPGAVRDPGDQGGHDRHLPGPARADPAQAGEGLPTRDLRTHPGVPARGPRARPPPTTRRKDRCTTRTRRTDAHGRGDGAGRPTREAEEAPVLPPEEVRAVLEALIFASPQPLTPREIGKVLGGVPKEAWQAALDGDARGLRARRPRPAARRGGGRLPDHHPPRVQRLGPRAARPADADAPVHPGPRDARRHRLQAAGDAARDHRAARREVGRRAQDAAREAPHPHHRPEGSRGPARCCTARPRSSCSTSA